MQLIYFVDDAILYIETLVDDIVYTRRISLHQDFEDPTVSWYLQQIAEDNPEEYYDHGRRQQRARENQNAAS